MNKKERAEFLIRKELSLNDKALREIGIPLGSLMIDVWREKMKSDKYVDTSELSVLAIARVLKYYTKIIFWKKKSIDSSVIDLVIGQTASTPHCSALIGATINTENREFLNKGSLDHFYKYINLKSRLKIILKGFSTSNYFLKLGKELEPRGKWQLFRHLSIMIARYKLSLNFIKKISPEVVLVDYDRGIFAPLVLASKELGVKTITLQHGAINSPYGYAPILADEIWVWGEGWATILKDLGVNEKRIKITGTPIIKEFNSYSGNHQLTKIGIGPNPVSDEENERIWKPIILYLNKMEYEVIVKLHPSQKKNTQIGNLFNSSCSTYEANEMTNEEFLKSINLLLVSTSGLGYEAVCAGVPVMVVKSSPESRANDWIMVEKMRFPEISAENLEYLLYTNKSNLSDLHVKELEGMKEFGFSKLGSDSINEMKYRVSKVMNENN